MKKKSDAENSAIGASSNLPGPFRRSSMHGNFEEALSWPLSTYDKALEPLRNLQQLHDLVLSSWVGTE